MFKLANNGNVLLDTSTHTPPNAAFILEAIEKSSFCDCKIDHDSINNFFKSANPERMLVVATKQDASLSVIISDDKMLATGELTLARGGKPIGFDCAKKELVKAKISRGYKQAFLEQLLQRQLELPPGSVITGPLAKGRQPVDGQPTTFQIMVETLKDRLNAPKLKEDGSVDMRDFGKLASVKPGELLIRQQPATPGQEGFTVTGELLPAKPGESHTLVAGEGTEISKSNPMELISSIAGVPVDINNGMRVDDIFTIKDVTVKSGHIDFEGSIIISSNIEPGMHVNAKGDITVLGTVESAKLTAGGDINVKQGIIGHHKPEDKSLSCELVCQGDIHASHAQYCYIEATNIFIEKQASHCSIKAKQNIQIGQPELLKGKLFGGEVINATKLVAGEIGNESGAKMTIHLAASGTDIRSDIEECFRELAKANEQLDSLQAALEKADLIKDKNKKNELISKIGISQLQCCQQAEHFEKQLSILEKRLDILITESGLCVNETLHSGVEIHIFDKVLRTTRNFPPCNVALENNKIEIEFKT